MARTARAAGPVPVPVAEPGAAAAALTGDLAERLAAAADPSRAPAMRAYLRDRYQCRLQCSGFQAGGEVDLPA